MHNLDSIDIACGQFIQRYYIFRVMVFDLKQVGNLSSMAAIDFGLNPIMQYLREESAR